MRVPYARSRGVRFFRMYTLLKTNISFIRLNRFFRWKMQEMSSQVVKVDERWQQISTAHIH